MLNTFTEHPFVTENDTMDDNRSHNVAVSNGMPENDAVNDNSNNVFDYTSNYEVYESGYFMEIYPFEITVLGYLQPTLVLLTTLTNLFVVGFFLSKKNRGKPTNLLFVSIALSDTLTGVTLLPNSVEVYAKDVYMLSEAWCNAYMLLRLYVSPVFHTVSVWQTVVLGIQRYLCVCHPFISGRICTFWKTFVSIVVMYCGAIILHTYHLLNNNLGHFRCRWNIEVPCAESCVYLWFCLVLQHLMPCLLLVLLTFVTLRELNKAQKRVSSMSLHRKIRKNSNRSTQDRIITITATLIVICFLIPELPHGIYKLVFVIYQHSGVHILPYENHVIISVYEIALIVSYNANFWIYCIMMHDFRFKLLKLLTCGVFKQGISRLRSFSASSKGSGRVKSLSRTSSNTSHNRVLSSTTSQHSATSENKHAVIPLTPTRGYDNMKFTELENHTDRSDLKQREYDANDDVFV